MDYFRIGQILRPHGIKGEVKILPLTDDLKRFSYLKEAYIEGKDGIYREATVEYAKAVSESAAIIKLAGTDSPEEAEKLRNKFICVDRLHAIKLPEGSYFVKDLIGCKAESTDGSSLGEITDVYETNANDVYVIRGRGNRKLSVPALAKVLNTVDTENKRVVFNADVLAEVGLFEN